MKKDFQSKVREEDYTPAIWKQQGMSCAVQRNWPISTPRVREGTVNQQLISKSFEETPKQSLRRVSNNFDVSISSVRRNTLYDAINIP